VSHAVGLNVEATSINEEISMTRVPTGKSEGNGSGQKVRAGSIDSRHLLLVGAGPGLGLAVAHRFAAGGYRVTLVARSADRLDELARSLADSGAEINTIEADASNPEDLRARMTELYSDEGAPGIVIYNAVIGAPDQLLSSTVTHL
jgi:short-subunit dehydrogenase